MSTFLPEEVDDALTTACEEIRAYYLSESPGTTDKAIAEKLRHFNLREHYESIDWAE